MRRKGHGASNQLVLFFLRYTINDEDSVTLELSSMTCLINIFLKYDNYFIVFENNDI